MATLSLSVCFAVIISLCCAFSNVWPDRKQDSDIVEELVQRIVRIEATQKAQQDELAAQKHLIEEQAVEIAALKEKCKNEGDRDEMTPAEEGPQSVLPDNHKHANDVSNETSTSDDNMITTTVGQNDKPQMQRISNRQTHEFAGVSFSAYLDHNAELGHKQTVKFNKVITNEGGAYNGLTGVFTCPREGVYLFSFFIGQRDYRQAYVELVVNSKKVVDAVVEGGHTNQDLQGGNVAIKRLNQGDVVWVDLYVGPHLEGSASTRLTTFSGALLYV